MKGLRTITRRFQQLRALHVARPVSRASDAAIAGKASALALAIKQIEASFGKGSLMQLGAVNAVAQVDVISTGSLAVDHALGIGGLPRGCGTHASPLSFLCARAHMLPRWPPLHRRVVEIFGPESSGKTTLALHVIAEAQKAGMSACFIDAEHALDPSYARGL